MNLQRVKSSNIEAIGHEGETLVVRFRGGATYEYEGVLRTTFGVLREAQSVGATFDRLIRKGSYKYRKVPPEEAASLAASAEEADG